VANVIFAVVYSDLLAEITLQVKTAPIKSGLILSTVPITLETA